MLDLAALELHFGTGDQVQGDEPRVGVGAAGAGGAAVLLGGGPVVAGRLVELGVAQ
ncbi:hypothetical protein ACWC2K_33865 [Streptomyces chattanoogensis]